MTQRQITSPYTSKTHPPKKINASGNKVQRINIFHHLNPKAVSILTAALRKRDNCEKGQELYHKESKPHYSPLLLIAKLQQYHTPFKCLNKAKRKEGEP